jgi:hypothetical protein
MISNGVIFFKLMPNFNSLKLNVKWDKPVVFDIITKELEANDVYLSPKVYVSLQWKTNQLLWCGPRVDSLA